MEDCTIHHESKKRARDESSYDPSSPEPKLSRVDSVVKDPETFNNDPVATDPVLNQSDSVPIFPESDRVESITDTPESYPGDNFADRVNSVVNDRVNSGVQDRVDSVVQQPVSPDTIQLTEEILDILEDTDIDSSIQGLDSVLKSFEEEMITPFPATNSGELDYLLGASDDELGLPPAKSPSKETQENNTTESVTSPYQNVELKEDFAFVDELHVYGSSEFGLGEDNYDRTESVTLGNGLFEFSDTPDYLWHPESLTAL